MRSLYSGVSGLKVHQTKMDVIGNNIANVNTTAFKASRVTFADYFSQTISSGQSGTAQRGGINPMQIGLGVSVASIDIDMTQGASQVTNRPMDVMVSGDGFFIVNKGNETFFTRDGNFGLDSYGNLVNSAGLSVMGWSVDDSTTPGVYKEVKGAVTPITLTSDQQYMPPQVTTALEASGNLNVVQDVNTAGAIENFSTISFFDSVGNQFTVDVKYEWDATTKTMGMKMKDYAYLNGQRTQQYPITVTGSAGNISLAFAAAGTPITDGYIPAADKTYLGTFKFTQDGVLDTNTANSNLGGVFNIAVTTTGSGLPADTYFGDPGTTPPNSIKLDLTNLTNFDNVGSSVVIEDLDGAMPGSLTGVSIGADGTLVGSYDNGEKRPLAFIPLAFFDNPSGLAKQGGNLFQTTANSGAFNGIGTSANDGGSLLSSGQLEMSNVDIAAQFVDMITTQRGFQANSKTITTSDEMLQELVNLKR